MSKVRRCIAALALAALALAVAYLLFAQYIMWFGFRDGYASELDRAEHRLATYLVWFSLAMGAWFVLLAFRPAHARFKKTVWYSCLLFALVASMALGLDLYFRSYMMDSAGG
jgi:hypothetical protein